MNEEITQLKKELKINRILLIVLLMLVIILIAALACVGIYAYKYIQELVPVIDELSKLDVKKFNEVMDKVSTIDVDTINEAIATLKEDMEDAREAIDGIASAFSAFFGK